MIPGQEINMNDKSCGGARMSVRARAIATRHGGWAHTVMAAAWVVGMTGVSFLLCPAAMAAPGDYNAGESGSSLLVTILISCAVSAVICLMIRSRNKTVRPEHTAEKYEKTAIRITRRDDRYTHTTRTVRHLENGGGPGGPDHPGIGGPGGPGYGGPRGGGPGPGGFGGPGPGGGFDGPGGPW